MHSASVWVSSLTMAAASGWFAATMLAQPATSKEPRFPQLTMDQLNEAQKPLGEHNGTYNQSSFRYACC